MKYIQEQIELERDTEQGWVSATIEIEARETDASYSHEFGVKHEVGIEILHAHFIDALDEDGEDVDLPEEIIEELKELACDQFLNNIN